MPLCGPSILKRMARIRLETPFMCQLTARWKTSARIIVRFRAHGPRAASKAISKSGGTRFLCAPALARIARRLVANRERYKMKQYGTVLASIASLALAVAPILAHHSESAQYDEKKPVTLKGVVTRFEWNNPH